MDINLKTKKKGGLGVKDLSKMNISLLCKWWWRIENGRHVARNCEEEV
jgi:hypothetical protein